MHALTVIMIPLAGTVTGAAVALFTRRTMGRGTEKFMLGLASGVMIAASVWSLIIPSIEASGGAWFPAAAGFWAGVALLAAMDTLIPHLHLYSREREGLKKSLSSTSMLILAVTLHNFPEGMAVGAVLALSGEEGYAAAAALATGIAIQNLPEGAIISLPLRSRGAPRWKAFAAGALSGLAEPAGAFLTIAVASHMIAMLPYCLGFAAGAMIYVVVDELIPEARSDNYLNISTIGTAIGFTCMMVLDVSLG